MVRPKGFERLIFPPGNPVFNSAVIKAAISRE
jgi:hypothetical protein